MTELNLLPPYLKKKKQQEIKIRNYILVGIIGLSVFLFIMYIPLYELSRVRSEEIDYKKQAEEANSTSIRVENENIKTKIENYELYIERVENLTQNKIMISNRISELEQYIPLDILFDSLTYGEMGLTINATAKSLDSISKFTANMQMSGTYNNVRVSNVRMESGTANGSSTQNSEVYKFTINAVE